MRIVRLFLLLAVAIPVSAAGIQAQEASPDREAPTFAMVVEVSGNAVAAACEEGCNWESVTATYPNGRYRISAEGIAPASAERDEATTFSFIVEASDGALSNRCDQGCTWLENSARYPDRRYRITQAGVGPAR